MLKMVMHKVSLRL